MASPLHQADLDSSAAGDSVASSPRSDVNAPFSQQDPRVRFMCSFGGKILPRPHDNLLRYVGGETRMVAVHRSTTFASLVSKLAKLSGLPAVAVKYQLPNEDLDALISVSTNEDVENMMEEYDRVALNLNPRSARLRLFLFPKEGELDPNSRTSSISSLLDGSTNREHWFFDALNSGRTLERGRSEASSIVSEMPDYFFGLENPDENQPPQRGGGGEHRLRSKPVFNDSVSASDPGSPAPVVSSSPYCSTSSVAAPPTSTIPSVSSIPDLPPVKTKPEPPEPVVVRRQYSEPIPEAQLQQQQQAPPGYAMQYVPESHYSGPPSGPVHHIPVYYVPGQGNVPVQQVQYRPQYVQQPQYAVPQGQMQGVGYHQVPANMGQQVQAGMGQVYGGMRPAMDPYEGARMVSDGMNQQQVYYGVRNANPVMTGPGHPGMMMAPSGEEMQKGMVDPKTGRISGP
ncbi:unnamed protein product [Linum tenue]|uniref:PB1 domain-containing protein n=2 Tax=Linum tenue TaxID=586396 RepID=A0AAV0JAP2_9ROSI|nr:unnamed protein product [Linum tenue]